MAEVFLNAAHGGEFSLRTGHGLKRDLVHSSTDLQHVLHLVENGQQPLKVMLWLVRMNVCDSRELRDDFVDPRVVFHCARPQRIEPRVDSEIALGQPGEMAYHFRLGEAWPSCSSVAHQSCWNGGW